MNFRTAYGLVLIGLMLACVDRINIPVTNNANGGLVIDGHISDKPGPYRIEIYSAHDLEDKLNRAPLSVKRLGILDNLGNTINVSEVDPGVYESDSAARGVVGRVYKLRIELVDGKIYESLPDSISSPGSLDSLYYEFNGTRISEIGKTEYGFDIFFDSFPDKNDFRYLWKFTGTFKAVTHPEGNHSQCFWFEGRCQFVLPCSGVRNVSNFAVPERAAYIRVAPCTCCTCWYNLLNDFPLISDAKYLSFGRFKKVKAYRVPMNEWVFEYRVHVQVEQMSLTRQTFNFWRAIRDQKTATGNLFQPITGKIPSNFVQIAGTPAPVQGIFYATAISTKSFYLDRNDVPVAIPEITGYFQDDCINFFPHSTYRKPSFWIE